MNNLADSDLNAGAGTLLDRLAIGLIAVAVAFIAIVAGSPFSQSLLAGAILMAIYGFFTKQRDLIAIAPFLPGFGLLAWWANYGIYFLTPHTIDSTLLRIDRGVGVAVFHWASTHPAIHECLAAGYFGLGLAAAVTICGSRRRPELLRACVIAAATAPFFYLLFPAVGPRWIGHAAARNCVPSLHMTWALLLWIYSPKLLRIPMLLFAVLIATATMGLGEHYAVDLLAALPFTVAVYVAARFPLSRLRHMLSHFQNKAAGGLPEA